MNDSQKIAHTLGPVERKRRKQFLSATFITCIVLVVVGGSLHVVKLGAIRMGEMRNLATYNLKEVTIWPYANNDEFKKAFKELQLPDDRVELNLPEVKVDSVPTIHLGGAKVFIKDAKLTMVREGPFTKLYEQYSKAGRERTAYRELLVKDANEKMVALKYNVAFVKNVTGIKDDDQAASLMEYCCLPEEFVLNANEYDLVLAVEDCYQEYIK